MTDGTLVRTANQRSVRDPALRLFVGDEEEEPQEFAMDTPCGRRDTGQEGVTPCRVAPGGIGDSRGGLEEPRRVRRAWRHAAGDTRNVVVPSWLNATSMTRRRFPLVRLTF